MISSLVFYYDIESYQKKKQKQLGAYITLIGHIKNQVECYLLPIDEILSSLDKKLLLECTASPVKQVRTLEEIISASNFYMDGECISLVEKFANEFGTAYRAEQLHSCDYYISELKGQMGKLKENNAKERKVHLALCLCASMSIVLLLI